MSSKYGEVEVVVVSIDNPRRIGSHGYNNWKYFYPSYGYPFKIQDILDAREAARSKGVLAVNADGSADDNNDIRHILWDLEYGLTKLKNPADVELFRGNPGVYNGIKKHQGEQKFDDSIAPGLPSVPKSILKSYDFPLNQILYGPPGTGKTYETKSLAVEIITGEKPINRRELNSRYNLLVKDSRIQFITFHQSYGYEDFVEGIKPKLDKPEGGDVEYEIKDGIFKQLCEKASDKKYLTNSLREVAPSAKLDTPQETVLDPKEYQGHKVWQLRVGPHGYLNEVTIAIDGISWFDKYNLEDEVKNSQGDVKKFTEMLEQNISEQRTQGKASYHTIRDTAAKKNMRQFCLKIKEGDLIIVHERPRGNKKPNQILAIVEISGDYKYEEGERYCHTRKIKFLWRKEDNGLNLNGQDLSERVICEDSSIRPEELIKKVNERIGPIQESEVTQYEELVVSNSDHTHPQNRFVLIIDEINRGNISKILGELITLLEEDKRLGNEEALEVTLPYSGDKFSIPNNLYIIGTMNTADRSIAFLDTALRRRFDFREMMPDSKILEYKIFEGVNLQQLLDAINFKIREELDRDHQIGHSYLINVKSISDLARAFKNKICPLLDEYFHDRREKVNSILNNSNLIINGDKDNWDWANDGAFQNPENYKVVYKVNSG